MRHVIGAVLVGLAAAAPLRAGDITTLSGTTFREVKVVRVEPDGVTWEHSTGLAKVDFSDLPDAVRREFHYDARKAAAFQAAQARERELAGARAQQAQREDEARRVQRSQAQTAETPSDAFVFRRRIEDSAAVRSTGEEIAARRQEEDLRTKYDGTMWDRRLWAVPELIFGSNPFDGVIFDPKTDFNSHEFKSTLHHSPGGFAPDTAHDSFFQPIYMTKSYYDEVDRAAAFARGRP